MSSALLVSAAAALLPLFQPAPVAPGTSNGALQPLQVYDGSWLVTPKTAPGQPSRVDHLTNHCHLADAFFTCEQVVNGKAMALLVFTQASGAGKFHSTVVMPDGTPGGQPGDLTIAGQHWTFLNTDRAGKPSFRVENTFRGRDHIHFEQFKASPDGSWQKTGEGDEVREDAR